MRYYLIFLLLFLSKISFTQKLNKQIQFTQYLSFNKFPSFTYSTNVLGVNTVKISAVSWGSKVDYKTPISRDFQLSLGVGYYKYAFSNINTNHSLFGNGNARRINYPSPILITYSTDKYWYNCISISLGIEKAVVDKPSFQLLTGVVINNYITYKQIYHIDEDDISPFWKQNKHHYYGGNIGISVSANKKLRNFYWGPSLSVPVFSTWKTDNVFPTENGSDLRNKWFNSLNLGIHLNYLIKKH